MPSVADHPECQACGYNLTGLPEDQGNFICPECGQSTPCARTVYTPRWRVLPVAAIVLLVVPVAIAELAAQLLRLRNEDLLVVGLIPVGFLPLCILAGLVLFNVELWRRRRGCPQRMSRRQLWLTLLLLLGMCAISLYCVGRVMGRFAAALASP